MKHYIPHSFIQHAHSPVLNVALYISIAPQLVTTVHLVVKQQPWMSAGEGSTVPLARTNQTHLTISVRWESTAPTAASSTFHAPVGATPTTQGHRNATPALRGTTAPLWHQPTPLWMPSYAPLDTTALLVSLWVGWASWYSALNQIDESWLLAANSFWRPVVFKKCIPGYSECYFLVILVHRNELWVCAQGRALT